MTALIQYDAACRAIAEARAVFVVKNILDKAVGMEAYARQAKNMELEADALEIRMRATRRVGQLCQQQKETVGLNQGAVAGKTGLRGNPVLDSRPTLASQGIDKSLAHRARRFAKLSDDQFEQGIARARIAVSKVARAVAKTLENEMFRQELPDGCTVEDLELLTASGQKFSVIYADPPWEFKVYSGKGKSRSADRHYETQGLDWVKSLPISALAADDCALLLWAVMPELPGALEVIKAWGFEYKTVGFTWVKQVSIENKSLAWGMGYWTRANAELCLLATKGAPKRKAKDVHQVIMAPVGEHSRKPEETSARIERLLPGPYLELFGRRPMAGWTVWGNQITRGLFHQEIGEYAPRDDFSKSVEACYEAVRERVASGGPTWEPK